MEKLEKGVNGSPRSWPANATRPHNPGEAPFVSHFLSRNSHKKAQKSQNGFLCFLCFFVANFLPRQILTDALYGLLFIDAAGADSDFRTIPCRQQQDAQDASRIGFNGVCWIGSK